MQLSIRILLFIFLLLIVIGCGNWPPGVIQTPPDYPSRISFIGNSFHDEGIDFDTLRSALSCEIDHLWNPGARTAWEYATLFRRILVDSIPDYIIFTNELNYLTKPSARTAGVYAADIEKAAAGFVQILDTIKQVIDSSVNIHDEWDFNHAVKYSFLPKILALANSYDIRVIYLQMRIIEYARDPLWEGSLQKQYRSALSSYLNEHGAILLDYSFEPEIEAVNFADGRHLNVWGRKKWTRMIAEDLSHIFLGIPAYHQISGQGASTFSIVSPESLQNLIPKNSFLLNAQGGNDIKWSYRIDSCPDFEKFIGMGSKLMASIMPFDTVSRPIWIYGYNGKFKENIRCLYSCSRSENLPPLVSAGPDLVSYVGRNTEIHAYVFDDSLSPSELVYRWQILKGVGQVRGFDSSTLILTPINYGEFVISLTVSDGRYEKTDIVNINVTGENQFVFHSLLEGEIVHPADTVVIRWEVTDVEDCVVSVSYDAGLSFEQILGGVISFGEPFWGQYPWIVPMNAPETDTAFIKLSNYEGTVSTISRPFSVKNK